MGQGRPPLHQWLQGRPQREPLYSALSHAPALPLHGCTIVHSTEGDITVPSPTGSRQQARMAGSQAFRRQLKISFRDACSLLTPQTSCLPMAPTASARTQSSPLTRPLSLLRASGTLALPQQALALTFPCTQPCSMHVSPLDPMHPNTDCVSPQNPCSCQRHHAASVLMRMCVQLPLDVPCMVVCQGRPLSMVQSDM